MPHDYNAALHAEQERIRLIREKTYSQKVGETVAWDPFELEWLYAATYKLLRVLQHTRDRGKAMDDLIDAANYIGLTFDRLTTKGFHATSSEELYGNERLVEVERLIAAIYGGTQLPPELVERIHKAFPHGMPTADVKSP